MAIEAEKNDNKEPDNPQPEVLPVRKTRINLTADDFRLDQPEIVPPEPVTVEDVKETPSLAELKYLIKQMAVIHGSRDYSSEQVLTTIAGAEAYLSTNMDDIVTGVFAGGHEDKRNELGRRVDLITRGGDLDLRNKVRELMMKEMEGYFFDKKPELAKRAITETTSLAALSELLNKFKYINDEIGVSILRPELKNRFGNASEEFNKQLWDGSLANLNKADRAIAIYRLLGEARIPEGAGLKNHLVKLMLEAVQTKEERDQEVKKSRIGGGSWFSRATTGLRRLFSRGK